MLASFSMERIFSILYWLSCFVEIDSLPSYWKYPGRNYLTLLLIVLFLTLIWLYLPKSTVDDLELSLPVDTSLAKIFLYFVLLILLLMVFSFRSYPYLSLSVLPYPYLSIDSSPFVSKLGWFKIPTLVILFILCMLSLTILLTLDF